MKHTTLLFDSQGHPTEQLRGLLELMQIEHDGTLAGIRDATQKVWYQEGKMRAEIREQAGREEVRSEVLRFMRMLGCIDEMPTPVLCRADYALLLGGTVVAVRKRVKYLMDIMDLNRNFGVLVVLGSERPLYPDKESSAVLFDHQNVELPFEASLAHRDVVPVNETEMMQLVLMQAGFHRLRRPVVTIQASGRANTAQTIEQWKETDPKPGSCLAVSSQPFVSFQQLVIANELQWGYPVTGIGPAANPSLPIDTFLDNVAKIMYELARAEGV